MEPRPKRVLVTEDEALISMMIEHELSRAGFDVLGPFPTRREASRWMTSDTPDIAVLDHELRDGPCTEIALELRRRGVSFVVLTGSLEADMPDVFRTAPRLNKPNSMEQLPDILARLLIGVPEL